MANTELVTRIMVNAKIFGRTPKLSGFWIFEVAPRTRPLHHTRRQVAAGIRAKERRLSELATVINACNKRIKINRG